METYDMTNFDKFSWQTLDPKSLTLNKYLVSGLEHVLFF